MRRIQQLLLGMMSLLVLMGTTRAQENTLLWQVSGNGLEKPSYLFGTYHLLGSSYLETLPHVQEAFDQSERVTVEMIIDSSALGTMQTMSIMPDSSLSQFLDSTEYAMVGAEVKAAVGMDIAFLEKLKPVSISIMLALVYNQQVAPELENYSGSPLDLHLAQEGKQQGKEVLAFETMLQQAELLYNTDPLAKQAEGLVELVKEKDNMLDMTRRLVDTYLEQDLTAMWELSMEMPNNAWGNMEALLDERNANWIKQLPEMMEERSTFVAVGALHLPGPSGLITQLQKAGYTVTPVHP